jgi:hypothetical protein
LPPQAETCAFDAPVDVARSLKAFEDAWQVGGGNPDPVILNLQGCPPLRASLAGLPEGLYWWR